jgi:hypothetical protein
MNGSSDLHRPLHFPTVAPEAACPQTPGARPNPDVAIALGSGPAYPVLGFEGNPIPPKPVVPLHAEDRKGNVYWHKTLWAVDPAYDGPVLIRAAGIDPPGAIRLAYDKRRLRELEFPAQNTDRWRYGPSVHAFARPWLLRVPGRRDELQRRDRVRGGASPDGVTPPGREAGTLAEGRRRASDAVGGEPRHCYARRRRSRRGSEYVRPSAPSATSADSRRRVAAVIFLRRSGV